MRLKDLKDEIERTIEQKVPTEASDEAPAEGPTEEPHKLSDSQCEGISGGRVGDHKPPT